MIRQPSREKDSTGFQWRGNSRPVAMTLVVLLLFSIYPLLVSHWAPPAPLLFSGGVLFGRALFVGGWWTWRWGIDTNQIKALWVKLWCPPGVLYMLVGLNQLAYVSALSISVPAAVVFLGEAHPVVTTLVLGSIYTHLGRPDRHAPAVRRSAWLMLLGLVGAGLVIASQGQGDYQIVWLGVALALAQAASIPVKVGSVMWWSATRSRDNETAGALFLGFASDAMLVPFLIGASAIWETFDLAVVVAGVATGGLVQGVGYILQRTALVESITPNINMFLLGLAPLAWVWLWLLGEATEAHIGLLLLGGACVVLSGALLNRQKRGTLSPYPSTGE